MNLSEKLFAEKAIDEFISEAVQQQEEKVAQKTTETLEYYKKYPFLYKSFFYESKLNPEFPFNWFLMFSFDAFVILAKMDEERYNTDETPNRTQEDRGWGTYGITFDDEFCALKFYKLDDYMKEMYELREKMSEIFMKLSN